MKHFMTRIRGVLLAVAALTSLTAYASDYPSRPIKWIVPYLAGTGPDMNARFLASEMSKELKESIIIENRGGAGGNLGARLAAKAPADGYHWVYSGSPMATNMHMYSNPGFDVLTDFVHVGGMTQSESAIIVNSESDVNDINALFAKMRANPGKLTYASGGIGTPAHIGAELALRATQTQALHIPYKGASESLNAVLGKQVDFAVVLVSVAQSQAKSGKIRALAVLSDARNAHFPSVPTLKELGLPDTTYVSSGGISMPKGVPAPIVEKVGQVLFDVLRKPQVRKQLEEMGSTVMPRTSQEFTAILASEVQQTEQLMRMMGLKPL